MGGVNVEPPATQRENQSVHKAAAILRTVAIRPGASVTAVAQEAGIPRATALRMIEALVREGLLARPGRRDGVLLGPEIRRLARLADPVDLLSAAAREPMARVAAALRESITLTVHHPDGSVEIVRQVDGPRMLGLANWVGRPFAHHASSSGKLAMASWPEARLDAFLERPLERLARRTLASPEELRQELAQIREQGWSEIEDELEDGLAAVSVPILVNGEVVGSINVSGPTARLDARARRAALPVLYAATAEIAALAGAVADQLVEGKP